jgi:hypothetical protein
MIQFVASENRDGQITVRTVGLNSTIKHPEIRVEIRNLELKEEAEAFLRYVSDYLTQYGKRILPGETLAYGYWLVKFEGTEPNCLETWEQNASGDEFVKGADLALIYWRDQHRTCSQHGVKFKPPRLNQLTVVSEGVFEGLPIKAVRYPSPDYMSGWWLITAKYDGNIKSLRNEHTFHITAARPELAQFLALPEGFRFHSDTQKAWLDEEAASATP